MKENFRKGESVMRKSTSIMGLLLVALFALSTFAPLSNADYTHQDLTMTVIINGNDASQYNTKDNPLAINVDNAISVHFAIQNNGETVHLTDMSMDIYTVQRILGIWDWEVKVYTHQIDVDNADDDGDGMEGFDIPAGLSESDSVIVDDEEIAEYKDQVRGQRVRIDVNFNFESISDYTITVYIDFV